MELGWSAAASGARAKSPCIIEKAKAKGYTENSQTRWLLSRVLEMRETLQNRPDRERDDCDHRMRPRSCTILLYCTSRTVRYGTVPLAVHLDCYSSRKSYMPQSVNTATTASESRARFLAGVHSGVGSPTQYNHVILPLLYNTYYA